MGYETAATRDRSGGSDRALSSEAPIGPGLVLGGRYELERRLGHGGMAVVWLATDARLGRPVAVKVLSEALTGDHDYSGRFRREARLAAGLQHPNLVSIYDYDASGRPYLVMEYVEGGDLAERMRAGSAPPVEQLARELLAALRHIHAAGVLHRDVKPQNVLVDRYGHARLSDFGIARPRGADPLTKTGEVIGTRSYLAPEVAAGQPASERSDLFALGVVLADAARGGADAALWALVDELRDPEPGARPASARAALAGLDRGSGPGLPGEPTQPFAITEAPAPSDPLAGSPAGVGFEPTPIPVNRRRRGARAVGALALVFAVTALGVVVALSSGGGSGGEPGAATPKQKAGAGKSASVDTKATDSQPAAAVSPAQTATAGTGSTTAVTTGGDGAALNDRGFALVGAGDYAGAAPVLERAVDALRDSGDQPTYNYALYNLATAYLGAGRPADAIPLLEERMRYDDGQLGEVQGALDRAYAAAGQKPAKPPKAEKPAKPEKAPKPE